MADFDLRARSLARRPAAISLGVAALLVSAPALARTTVDAAAKPWLISAGIVAALLFSAVGGLFYRIGRRTMRLGEATRDWPTASGQVISAEVVKKKGYNDGEYEYYSPEIRYSYVVNAAPYTGDTIKFGLSEIHYFDEEKAREWVTRYSVGAAPQVRYDPAKPETSALEFGQVHGGRQLFAGLLLLMVALGAVWFSISTALTPVE